MVPSLILIGLIGGRWWRVAPIVGAAGWTVGLLAAGVVGVGWGLVGVVAIAIVNVAVGVLVHQAVRWLVRHRRRRREAATGP